MINYVNLLHFMCDRVCVGNDGKNTTTKLFNHTPELINDLEYL